MSQYIATSRSNEFRVKDVDAFVVEMEHFDIGVWIDNPEEHIVSIYDQENNGWSIWDEDEDGEPVEVEIIEVIAKHLTDDSVAILFEVGAEKLRYVNGSAIAFNSQGKFKSINLDDIYNIAQSLGSDIRPL